MSKRKGSTEEVTGQEDAASFPADITQPESPPIDVPVDRMAKARAAKKDKTHDSNGHKQKGADILYVIVGESNATGRKSLVGMRRTRGQCRKQWEALKDMASQIYDTVYVVKGKRIEVYSL